MVWIKGMDSVLKQGGSKLPAEKKEHKLLTELDHMWEASSAASAEHQGAQWRSVQEAKSSKGPWKTGWE